MLLNRFPLVAQMIAAMMSSPAMAFAAPIVNRASAVRGGARQGVERLGRVHPTDANGQHRNAAKSRKRKLMRQMGGRRQFLKTTKELRAFKATLQGEVAA